MLIPVVTVVQAAPVDLPYEVYGALHVSLDAGNDGFEDFLALVSNASRFGVKGHQEMNEHISLIWQFESTMDMAADWQYTRLADRNSFLGLETRWGTLLAGKHDTPFKKIAEQVDLFRHQIGDLRQITFDWDNRLDHCVMFRSPEGRPLEARLAYQALGNCSAIVISGSVSYSRGGLWVGLGYEDWGEQVFFRPLRYSYSIERDPADEDGAVIHWHSNQANTDPQHARGYRIASTYSGPWFSVAALYQSIMNQDGRLDYYDGRYSRDLVSRSYGVGGSCRLADRWWLKGEAYFADPNTKIEKDQAVLYAWGLDYRYDDDLTFYIQSAYMSNADLGGFSLGGGVDGHGFSIAPRTIGNDVHQTTSDSPFGGSVGITKRF